MSLEFTDAVARCPQLWGRQIVGVLEVKDGMANVWKAGLPVNFWVPVEKLERVGKNPVRTVATRQPSKRSEVC